MYWSLCWRSTRPIYHASVSRITTSWRRSYSSEVRDDGPIRIQVGSSGAVSIDLFQPFSSSGKPPLSFLFFLPRGPIPFNSPSVTPEPTDLRPLATAADAVVARVNYRLLGDSNARYPLPIHDVAAAWNWLFGLRMQQGPGMSGSRYLPPIGVCGEFIGGSLATMLALTECHARPMPGITAAYLGNPVIDWTMMGGLNGAKGSDEESKEAILEELIGKRQKTKSAPSVPSWQEFADASELSSSKLLPLRQKLFADSSYWFDRFASPLLFFRTPSEAEPNAASEEDETFEAVMQTVIDEPEAERASSPASTSPSDADKTKENKFKVSNRRWPPLRSGLVLPDMHVTLGSESPVRDQGELLVKCMNRSVFHNEQDKAGTLEEVQRATMETRAGAGAWDGEELVRIGEWFKETLRYE